MVRSTAILLLCLVFSAPVFASTQDDFKKTTKELEESREREAELKAEREKIRDELDELQKELVESASVVRKGEKNVSEAEEKLRILRQQQDEKNAALKTRRSNLESLVRAALRLSQTPPEAMVMLPGDRADIIKAAGAMGMTTKAVREEINSIQLQIAELERLEIKIAERHDDVLRSKDRLAKDRQALQRQIDERKKLQNKLAKEERAQAQKTAELAKKAKNLQALVDTLDAAEKAKRKDNARKGGLRSFAKAKGKITRPVAGKMVQNYGSPNAADDTEKGIVIQAAQRARVVAPYDGEVVFAGPFRSYGNMIIIRHSEHYHSLLAGLDTIDTQVGDFLLEGEPIGAMGEEAKKTKLYVELRDNNEPTNPTPWLGKGK